MPDLRAAHAAVLERIARACARAGRSRGDVELLAVSKDVPADRLRAALAAGISELAENRVQEALAKAEQLPAARWHLVGHLQRNKAARAVALFETIHSVDSLELAIRLDELVGASQEGRPALPVYLQVNVDNDPAKAGFGPAEIERQLPELTGLARVELRGLMTVGRLVDRAEDARPTFVRLRRLSERLRASEGHLGPGLSMGMSADFDVAVEEGATVVRVGRAIFGQRPPG